MYIFPCYSRYKSSCLNYRRNAVVDIDPMLVHGGLFSTVLKVPHCSLFFSSFFFGRLHSLSNHHHPTKADKVVIKNFSGPNSNSLWTKLWEPELKPFCRLQLSAFRRSSLFTLPLKPDNSNLVRRLRYENVHTVQYQHAIGE